MLKKIFTCVECPLGCELSVMLDGEKISVSGNGCPRGKAYAEDEAVCPKRVVTSTVKTSSGKMLAVKTDGRVKKEDIFMVMDKISQITVDGKVGVSDIIIKDIADGINLVATDYID